MTNPAAFTGGRISIHALREEGDVWCWERADADVDFYPRPPRGGRPYAAQMSALKP